MNGAAAPILPTKRLSALLLALLAGGNLSACNRPDAETAAPTSPGPTTVANLAQQKAEFGRDLFFDARLSNPPGRACASCHAPSAAFSDPDRRFPVSRGAETERFAKRNTPSLTYAAFVPPRHFDEVEQHYVGGLFLDGRANNLEEQAPGPMASSVEMNLGGEQGIANAALAAGYASRLEALYGKSALESSAGITQALGDALARFQRLPEFAPFSSRYDRYLAGEASLSPSELRGLELFEAEDKGNCAACHPSRPDEQGQAPLFTDFTYDNIGLPANPKHPFLSLPPSLNPDGTAFRDRGLGADLGLPEQDGKFRVPSLRNIALTAPYMHNGVLDTLEEVMEFYNRRDLDTQRWGPPEVAQNVNTEELGDLGLSDEEIQDIIAFMKTLSDETVDASAP